ncbi:RTA1-domain-containing protein [Trametes sanguinea]|nr:RTA1-domain-containing protein [Trametes sanguinea]
MRTVLEQIAFSKANRSHYVVTQAADQVTPYGYTPTKSVCIALVVLFGITSALHAAQAIRYRLWWLLPTAVLGGLAELVGWIGRLWSSINPPAIDPYLIQVVATIVAPTPFIAANFMILGHIIKQLGSQYSRLSARWYAIVFVACDFGALVAQALGGAQAANAVQNNKDPDTGGHIMLGGIAFQLIAICVYALLALEFLLRYRYDKPFKRGGVRLPKTSNRLDRGTKLMMFALLMMWIFLFIRSVYRTIELSNGWTGRIITTERYFNILDGAMIVLAMFTLNFFHPGLLLGNAEQWKSLEMNATRSEIHIDTLGLEERQPKGDPEPECIPLGRDVICRYVPSGVYADDSLSFQLLWTNYRRAREEGQVQVTPLELSDMSRRPQVVVVAPYSESDSRGITTN